ncbi:MAG: T9SS type A sorting domain-containing protein [Sediminibacterium sp.]|nr:T9SS type A sorting domain-containing protein [Sediminibacterium sp.]
MGVSVLSTLSTNDSSYGYSSGTSMSSPGVAGSLLLLQELSYKLTNKPVRSATLKALAIHTANEAGTSPGPDYKFGWGLMNSSEAATTLNNALSTNNASSSTDLVYEDVLQNQGSKTYNIVASGKKALKATLVWTDIKGVANNSLNNNTPKLVNDLDLKISSGNSVVETWNLNPANPSEAAKRGNNKIDNVEKVEIDSVIVGNTYTITVSHKNNLDRGSQAYSLIISGGGGAAYCTSTASSNAGTKIDSVTLNNILFANTTNNQYIDNTKQIINGEPLGNLNFSIKTSSTDASNNTRFIHIYIDYNNNGVFESTELASVSNALTNGIYAGTFNLPGNLTIGTITRLRIVAMETAASSNLNPCGAYSIGETQDYTIKINNPSNDLQLSDIVSPIAKACKTGTQYITVKIVNNGGGKQTNFPINVVVKKGSTTLRTITETFNGTLAGLENMNYTFQTPISLEENTSYDITATVSLNNDQLKENNSISSSFLTSAVTPAPSAIANNCNNSVQLRVNNPISSNRYFWYDSSSTINPVGQGASTVITSSASKLNVGSGYAGFIGPLNNKSLGTSGGYNSFSGNYVKINATSAMTIETTKLYTGNPGKIEFTLGTFASENSDGSYSYFPIQTVSLNVGASSPTPLAANGSSATPFIEGDSGRTYYLNLKIPQAGDYIIIVKCTDATLFRNNGLGNNTYPLGPNKVFSFTGNSVTAASGNFQNFFYFFYNTQISTNDCPSPLSSVPVSIVSKPIITQTNDSTLSASTANSYQWFVNDSSISGANNQTLIAKRNALYKVTTTTGSCSLSSDPKLVLVTNIIEASVKEISLKITSSDYIDNMIKGGSFYIQFSNIQSRDIKLDIINSMGERVFQKDKLVNQNGPQLININSLNAGIYFVRIFANNKVYIQRVFITQ